MPPATTAPLRTDPHCLPLIAERNQVLEMAREAQIPLPHWEDADGPIEDMFIHTQTSRACLGMRSHDYPLRRVAR